MSARTRASRSGSQVRLEVDWARCRGHGHCSTLLPELVRLDPWGFPIVADAHGESLVPPDAQDAAERAVSWCPNLALRLRG